MLLLCCLMNCLTPLFRKKLFVYLTYRNEMKETIQILQKLKRFDYSVFQFTDFYTPVSTSLHSFMESNKQHLIRVAKRASRMVNVASNVCKNIWEESHYNGELPIDNDGVLFTCIQSLFKYFFQKVMFLGSGGAMKVQSNIFYKWICRQYIITQLLHHFCIWKLVCLWDL